MTIQDILREYSIPFREAGEHHHSTEGWVNTDCPSCSRGQGRFKLGIPINGFVANCWSCGRLLVLDILVELTGESASKVKQLLGGLQKDWVPSKEKPHGRLKLPAGIGPLLPAHRHYLISRGFDPDELQRLWGLQGIGIDLRLAWRLYIPIYHDGKQVSWTTRSLVNEGLRYINAKPEEEARSLKSTLIGLDYCRSAIVVTEGPFDAFRIGPGATATFGVNYTKQQVAQIAKYPLRVILFDAEKVAQDRARKLCDELAPFGGRTVRCELDAKDPGSASPKEVKKFRKAFLE